MSLEEKLRRFAGWLGLLTAALGIIVLIGWTQQADPLAFLRLNTTPMKPSAAACLILGGVSLWFQLRRSAALQRIGLIVASGALVLATLAFAQRMLQLDLGLEDFFAHLLGISGKATGRQMSMQSAVALISISVALVALRQQSPQSRWPIAAWLANLVIGFSIAGLLATEFAAGTTIKPPVRISSHLAIALMLLGIGTLFARPEDRHVRMLIARTTSGMLARRLLLAVAIAPLCFGAAVAWFVRQDALTLTDGFVLLVVAMIASGFAIALFSLEAASDLSQSREEVTQARAHLTARLQEQAAQLQETVAQRTRELREANASLSAAAESSALLALVAQNTTNGVIISDAKGRINWVNAAFTRLTGYELSEVQGRKPGSFLQGPGTDPAAIAKLREAERTAQPCTVEILNYTKAGTPFWQILDMQPARDAAGNVVNFVAHQTDITGQRADKTRLEHLNQRLELATRSADLGIWEWDAGTQRGIWDRRMLEIYGIRPEDFKGTLEEWIERVVPAEREAAIAQAQTAPHDGDHFAHEFRITRLNDGAVRHIQSRAIVQRDARGQLVRVTGTERDITTEREGTQRIKALNERLSLALRSAHYGVWELDITTNRRHWDDRVLEMFGIARHEFDDSSAKWLERVHPEDRPAATENLRQVIAGELHDYATYFRVIRPDGSVRHLDSHGYVQRDAQGKPIRLVGLSRDITEQKHLAQALDFAEQRWQLALEGTNDSVWDWDLTTDAVYHDARWARMLGYEPGELENTNAGWKTLVHPDDLPANEIAVQAHFAQRTPSYEHELRIRAKDGTWRWILDRGKVVRRAPDGQPLRMAGAHTDITERKRLEQRLHKSEELANEVSRLAQIGGWEIDLVTSRVTWSDGTRRIHDVDTTFQPTPESIWQFFPPEALATVQTAFNRATPSAPSFEIEVPLLTARGRRRWVRILGHGEFRQGKATSVHGAIQDVTTQHESEEARRQLETQLFQAQKMETLGTLAGGIAHDFNNLLTGIIGYHELAADSLPEDHPSRLCLDEARNASLRARELVDRILTFGRQSVSAEHGAIDLSVVVEEARRFLRSTLPANITIEAHCAPHCGMVLADATQIHQVLLNLGSNAAHAMRLHGGMLRILLEPTEVSPDLALTLGGSTASSYVRLSVSDTGHGMDEATRRRIFDPFFTTKNSREGTGLGLAVVHGIIRSHRGAIDVESTPGKGSTFYVYLPTAHTDDGSLDPAVESAPRGGGEFVCVVDDEEVVGSCTKLVLENKGYRTLVFSSAEACLAELEANPSRCAVLVTDQTMPGKQGTELATCLRRTNPALPVVIMSGYFSKISPQALDELGQIELLGKPFTTDELLLAVHRALHPAASPS